jgi:hypothetical protein
LVTFFLVEEKRAMRTQNFHQEKTFHDLPHNPPDMPEISGGKRASGQAGKRASGLAGHPAAAGHAARWDNSKKWPTPGPASASASGLMPVRAVRAGITGGGTELGVTVGRSDGL